MLLGHRLGTVALGTTNWHVTGTQPGDCCPGDNKGTHYRDIAWGRTKRGCKGNVLWWYPPRTLGLFWSPFLVPPLPVLVPSVHTMHQSSILGQPLLSRWQHGRLGWRICLRCAAHPPESAWVPSDLWVKGQPLYLWLFKTCFSLLTLFWPSSWLVRYSGWKGCTTHWQGLIYYTIYYYYCLELGLIA